MPRGAVVVGVLAVLSLVVLALGPGPATAATPTQEAPATTLSADGRTASGGGLTLSVSQAADLDPEAAPVTVTGAGYDEDKGVYVSLCVIPPAGSTPTPCGGGIDRENTSGASAWISSNPPSYAGGVSQPYEPGGRFEVVIEVSAAINDDLDCRQVRCAIVTRNDHTRGSDRSQDVLIPVTFAAASGPATTVTNPSGGTATDPSGGTTTTTTAPATTTTTDPTRVAPSTTLAADGRSVSDGTRTLAVDDGTDLDPDAATVAVSGDGFDPAVGVYVALCALPAARDAEPGPCSSGDGATWLSSNPPEYGVGVAEPFDDGTFSASLTVRAVIDSATDCRSTACAITTRSDDTAPGDRRNDLFVPVTFASTSDATSAVTTSDTETDGSAGGSVVPAEEIASSPADDSASAVPVLLAGIVVVAAIAAGTISWRRRRTT